MTSTTSHPQGRRRSAQRLVLMTAVCVLALATCAPGWPSSTAGGTHAGGEDARALESRTVALRFDAGLGRAGAQPGPGGRVSTTGRPPPADEHFVEVDVQRPTLRLSGPARDGRDAVAAALGVPGVTFATAVHLAPVALALDDDERIVQAAVVDPAGFRRMVPQVTADAVDVWRRIDEGDAALTHELGHELQREHGIDLGERVALASGGRLRVGAYASNGAPPVAELVLSRARAAELGLATTQRLVLVAVDTGAERRTVAAALEAATGLEARVIDAPPAQRAFLTGAASSAAFETFAYVSLGDGMIQIDPDWVGRNIASARLPIFRGEVTCHRLMLPQLRGALRELVDRDLDHLIEPEHYGGCWVPRHILFDPRRGLSMHAWGLAVDFNVPTNGYGAEPQLDPRVVEVFERWGFAWGGHWSTPDGMHFELRALVHDQGG